MRRCRRARASPTRGHDTRAGPGRASRPRDGASRHRNVASARHPCGAERSEGWTGRGRGYPPVAIITAPAGSQGRVGQPSGYPDRWAPQPSPSSATPPHQRTAIRAMSIGGVPCSDPCLVPSPPHGPGGGVPPACEPWLARPSSDPCWPSGQQPRPGGAGGCRLPRLQVRRGLASRATADSPQSKLWYADGSWWGGLFKAGTGAGNSDFAIYKYNPATETWTNTLTLVDRRDRTHADYLWVAAQNKLYVASTKDSCTGGTCNDAIRIYRFSYASGAYTLDSGSPRILLGGVYRVPACRSAARTPSTWPATCSAACSCPGPATRRRPWPTPSPTAIRPPWPMRRCGPRRSWSMPARPGRTTSRPWSASAPRSACTTPTATPRATTSATSRSTPMPIRRRPGRPRP